MSPPKPDLPGGANRHPPRRKLGRPFKIIVAKAESASSPDKPMLNLAEAVSATGLPPALPYRSFKIALAVFKQQGDLPDSFDRAAFSNKLHNTNVREIIEAYRFLGLTDEDSAPTPAFKTLVSSAGEESWPIALCGVIERSYDSLLACDPVAVTDGLHRAFRLVYEIGSENTRRRSSFFLHACRDVALFDTRLSGRNALHEMPVYDAAWPDDMKRQWFGTFHDLVQRLDS
jgi:hypothetical protein